MKFISSFIEGGVSWGCGVHIVLHNSSRFCWGRFFFAMDLRAWIESGKRREAPTPSTAPSPSKQARQDVNEETFFSADKAARLLAMDEFKDQRLILRKSDIYCVACKSEVGCEPRLLRQHCFQKQTLSARAEFERRDEEGKSRLRHYVKMLKFAKKAEKAAILEAAVARNKELLFAEAEGAVAMRKRLDEKVIAKRVQVFETLSGAGVPLSKLDDPDFLALVEGDGPRLGGRQGVLEVQEFVQRRQSDALRKTLSERMVGFFCDGSKANYLIEAAIARFVTDAGEIEHVCIGLSRIDRSLDGAQLKGVVQQHLDNAGISKPQLMAATTDSAAVNKAMGKQFNWEVRPFPEATRFSNSFPIHHCFSHMVSNSGAKWRESMVASVQILSGLKGLRVSDSAKSLFKELTGSVLPDGTENRWFYWVDFVKAVLPHWSTLPTFVRRCKDAAYMPKKVAKMNVLVNPNTKRDALRAGLEMQFMVSLGQPLAQVAYFLEGDGFLAPYAFSRLNLLNDLVLRVASMDVVEDNEYVVQMRAFANRNPGDLFQNVHEDLIKEVWRTRTVLAEYWKASVWEEMRYDVQLFRGFSVLDPLQLALLTNAEVLDRLNGLREGEEIVSSKTSSYRRFKGVKGFNENVQQALFAQLAAYRVAASSFAPQLALVPPAEQPAKLWEWWWSMRNEKSLCDWSLLARIAVLHQPSSAVIERFFSVYKGMTSAQQCQEDEETSLLRAFTRYNKGKVGL
jgi:hypothetical protein